MAIWKALLLLALVALCSAKRPNPHDPRCRSSRPVLHTNCRHRSYAFNRSTKRCTWTCGRGPFETQRECDLICRSAAVCTGLRPSVFCHRRAFAVYYFSDRTGKCHLDMGCSYRGNNFPSLGECRRTCKAKNKNHRFHPGNTN
uniref:Putative tick kunitz 26 n=1 Tax=Amblyomma cajennense TaxID=34607 RepID=A0A023FRA2_AMBCJ